MLWAYWQLDTEAETGRCGRCKTFILTKGSTSKKATSVRQDRRGNSTAKDAQARDKLRNSGNEVQRTEKAHKENICQHLLAKPKAAAKNSLGEQGQLYRQDGITVFGRGEDQGPNHKDFYLNVRSSPKLDETFLCRSRFLKVIHKATETYF